ncbi:pyridoxal phosphate-dependent aminotransferase [Magnetospira sp. QH-2]|uniref:pyridoxal phosphate-dependent aminotransferase n=1 Tax=Magnetospira sp. (strain QH-2) TaxID=1288970 RepID=UPI0003E8143E|nr:aminotransferase class I/II-fold pyridoxal phosphate-dependent enzyme [Magnetospira sp. QH-2]CCQ72400.1 aspartate aminotransferase [Magnetospira sp. QH-2]
MALKVASRATVPPFIVMDVMRAANAREMAGKDVLHLEVGQPGSGAPAAVREAARRALDEQRLGYTDALGLPALRQAIAKHYQDDYGQAVDAERVVVTTGSSGAFVLSFLSCFDAGDRVAQAAPGYPAYRNILSALGVEAVDIPVGPDSHFQPTPALLDQVDNLDGLILASPGNPTGSMIDRDRFAELVAYCAERDIRLISDEIYHGITYEQRAETVLAFTDDALVINSFSKYFAMTGWRLGWMVMPSDMLRAVECLAQNLFISPPALSQYAGIHAFDAQEELQANVARYARNRQVLLDGLPKAGFTQLAPSDGAFYVYADISALTDDSPAFCRRMLDETGVAATPGTDFDPARGHRFIRFSYAGTTEDMTAAMAALARVGSNGIR